MVVFGEVAGAVVGECDFGGFGLGEVEDDCGDCCVAELFCGEGAVVACDDFVFAACFGAEVDDDGLVDAVFAH